MGILGIDFGVRWIGIAIAEKPSYVAVPLGVITPKDDAELIATLRKLVVEREVEVIVVGLPLESDGKKGKMAKEVISRFKAIEGSIGAKIRFVDERLTSKEALNYLSRGVRGDKKKKRWMKIVDAISAALILDVYVKRELIKK